MILEPTQKIFVSHRRLFDKDESRYFVGEVVAYEAGIVKVSGYSFVRDFSSGMILRKEDIRTKIVSVTSGMYLIYQLPNATDIGQARVVAADGNLILTDSQHLRMNLAEIPHQGHF